MSNSTINILLVLFAYGNFGQQDFLQAHTELDLLYFHETKFGHYKQTKIDEQGIFSSSFF